MQAHDGFIMGCGVFYPVNHFVQGHNRAVMNLAIILCEIEQSGIDQ